MEGEDTEIDRTEREMIAILNGLPKDLVEEISPQSLPLKRWLKLPMILSVLMAACLSSLSELWMKAVGLVLLYSGDDWRNYLWILLFIALVVLTAYLTIIYVNYGIKYYSQMETMPVY